LKLREIVRENIASDLHYLKIETELSACPFFNIYLIKPDPMNYLAPIDHVETLSIIEGIFMHSLLSQRPPLPFYLPQETD
jgi:hypothetical protein